MLRILHTADWHLGQTFHGFDRDYEHGLFLDWLLRTLAERQADVLLIAGDIFDSVNPSAAAQRRFYDFLARAHTALPKLQIVLTAGNHDAGARLEAPAGLMESLNITVVGTVPRDTSGALQYRRFVAPLRDAQGRVAALALAVPFLRPADVPEVVEAVDAYLDGIRELYRRVVEVAQTLREQEYPQAVLVGLGHCHIQGGEESRDSERRIVIGGAEALRTDTFPAELAYVALGHLHRPQQFEGGRLHYCGSPIPLSFSEKDYEHRVVEILLDDAGCATFHSVPIPKIAALRRLPANKAVPIAELLLLLAETVFDDSLPPEAHPFLELRVLDDGPDPTRRRRIEEALAGKAVRLASIKLEAPPRPAESLAANASSMPTLADLSALDPEEILLAAHRERYHAEPEPAVLAAFHEILTAEAHSTGSVAS
ncbi:MAG TPA: exonuclease SbcCD subunit D [Chthoniobacter sp.]|nr:exonuclease SbcCD subunit D [Chthoniobacter sp.]